MRVSSTSSSSSSSTCSCVCTGRTTHCAHACMRPCILAGGSVSHGGVYVWHAQRASAPLPYGVPAGGHHTGSSSLVTAHSSRGCAATMPAPSMHARCVRAQHPARPRARSSRRRAQPQPPRRPSTDHHTQAWMAACPAARAQQHSIDAPAGEGRVREPTHGTRQQRSVTRPCRTELPIERASALAVGVRAYACQ